MDSHSNRPDLPILLAPLLAAVILACGSGASRPSCPRADCDPVATCSDASGAPVCTCPAGHDDRLGDGTQCVDHDACAANPCFPGVACTDHPAPDLGRSCGPCPEGSDGDGVTCTARAARAAAAQATAASGSNACSTLGAFYWEIGDAGGPLASGAVTPPGSETAYDAGSLMAVASASKWIYAASHVQRRGGALTAEDVKYLTFTSGYTSFGTCLAGDTVDSCLARGDNGAYTAATDGFFYYSGGHMQRHASLNGLGPLDDAGLADEARSQLGADVSLAYALPQPAGGVATTPAAYAVFLRKILSGELLISGLLGSHAVCTNPATCPGAISTPSPDDVSFHYSLGHWVEDDPVTGDGSFSSAGAFGFYPWVDSTRTLYGVVARKVTTPGAGFESLGCGRLIRIAWRTATPQ